MQASRAYADDREQAREDRDTLNRDVQAWYQKVYDREDAPTTMGKDPVQDRKTIDAFLDRLRAEEAESPSVAEGQAASQADPDAEQAQNDRSAQKDLTAKAHDLLGTDPDTERATFVPIGRDENGDLVFAAPQVVIDAARGFLAPGHVLEGGQVTLNDITAAAGVTGGGSLFKSTAGRTSHRASKQMANEEPGLYNPPERPQRSFEEDYPHGAETDADGRLLHDIEGRPLRDATRIAGRRLVGGPEEGIGPKEHVSIAKEGTRKGLAEIGESDPRRAYAYVEYDQKSKKPEQVFIRTDMAPEKARKVLAHEVGHIIDQYAGEIPTKGLDAELAKIYNTLNNPNRYDGGREAHPEHMDYRPEDFGYSAKAAPREMMAEAIRAYMANPNYLKTEAPKTAAAIRARVNSHPELSKIIQFNSDGMPMWLMPSDPSTAPAQSSDGEAPAGWGWPYPDWPGDA